ncbi:tudor staphylococcal nuclease [Plasmodium gonderi]|uniref:Tudor staphylococcal nuclease n=1 Tax=Plasmodium gonderi TaxID=77519 RepID=A0A1Y1JFU1_PLAGO|nr:tudor staphylococcal nuclease [Plasmodium gonderi]GAW81130.1 tudor staphylococcal nuclease [Plasmodium gonderi]
MERLNGIVKQVTSADTYILTGAKKGGVVQERQVSLACIQCPRLFMKSQNIEKNEEPFAWESREFIRKMIIGKNVSFVVEYIYNNRTYCSVFFEDQNLSILLLQKGYANLVSNKNIKTNVYADLESYYIEAKEKKIGIFGNNINSYVRNIVYSYNDKNQNKQIYNMFLNRSLKCVVEHVRDGSNFRVYAEIDTNEKREMGRSNSIGNSPAVERTNDDKEKKMKNKNKSTGEEGGVKKKKKKKKKNGNNDENNSDNDDEEDGKKGKEKMYKTMYYFSFTLCGIIVDMFKKEVVNNVENVKEEPYAMETKKFVESRLLNRDIEIEIKHMDNNCNLYANVHYKLGNICTLLLKNGYAYINEYTIKYVENAIEYKRALDEAIQLRKKKWINYTEKKVDYEKEYLTTVIEVLYGDVIIVDYQNEERRLYLASIKCEKHSTDLALNTLCLSAKDFLKTQIVGEVVKIVTEYVRTPQSNSEGYIPPCSDDKGRMHFVSVYKMVNKKKENMKGVNGTSGALPSSKWSKANEEEEEKKKKKKKKKGTTKESNEEEANKDEESEKFEKVEKNVKNAKSEKIAKSEKTTKSEKTVKNEKTAKNKKTAKSEKNVKGNAEVHMPSDEGYTSINMNEQLVAKGLAKVMNHRQEDEKASNYFRLQELEKEAEEKKLGRFNPHIDIIKINNISGSENSLRARSFENVLNKYNNLNASVDYIYGANKFKLYIPSQNLLINFILLGITVQKINLKEINTVSSVNNNHGSSAMQNKKTIDEYDGEDVNILNGNVRSNRKEKIELKELAIQAYKYTRKMLMQRNVQISIITCDKGGNFIGILRHQNKDFSIHLLSLGFGTLNEIGLNNTNERNNYVKAVEEAKKEKRNIWSIERMIENDDYDEEEEERKNGVSSSNAMLNGHKNLSQFDNIYYCSYVEDINNISIQLKSKQDQLKKLQDELNKPANLETSSQYMLSEVKKNTLVIAKYIDKCYYRAVILQVNKNKKKALVKYIDFGNEDELNFDDIKKLSDASLNLKNYPPFSIRVSLAGVKIPNENKTDLIIYIKKFLLDKFLYVKFEKKEKNSPFYYVVFYDYERFTTNKNVKSVNEDMVASGICYVDNRSDTKIFEKLKKEEIVAKKEKLIIWAYGDIDYDEDN